MKDYLFTKEPNAETLYAGAVDQAVKPTCSKVKAATVATHTDPWSVILHCHEELTATEKEEVNTIIQNI